MSKAVFEVDFIEVADHVFGLVFGVIDFLNAVEDNSHDDFVRHDSCVVKEVFVAFLDAFYG